MNDWKTPLDHANEIRLGRARLKRRIYAGELALPDVLDPAVELEDREAIEKAIAKMPLEQLVSAARGVGTIRFGRLWFRFSEHPFPKNGLTVRDLGLARRAAFAAYLRMRGIGLKRPATHSKVSLA